MDSYYTHEFRLFVKLNRALRISKGDLYAVESHIVGIFSEPLVFKAKLFSSMISIILSSAWLRRSDKITILIRLMSLKIFYSQVHAYTYISLDVDRAVCYYIEHKDAEMIIILSHLKALLVDSIMFCLQEKIDINFMNFLIQQMFKSDQQDKCVIPQKYKNYLNSTIDSFLFISEGCKLLIMQYDCIPRPNSCYRSKYMFGQICTKPKYSWLINKLIDSDLITDTEICQYLINAKDAKLIDKCLTYASNKHYNIKSGGIKLYYNIVKNNGPEILHKVFDLLPAQYIFYRKFLNMLWNNTYKRYGAAIYLQDLKKYKTNTYVRKFIKKFKPFKRLTNN